MAKKTIKIALVGECGVGKSLLARRYNNYPIGRLDPTNGIQVFAKETRVPGEIWPVRVEYWDTPGRTGYIPPQERAYRDADAFMLVYDIGKGPRPPCILRATRLWLREIHELAPPTFVIQLVGNKSDVNRSNPHTVPSFEGRRYAQESQFLFIETSALKGTNIDAAFNALCVEVFYRKYLQLPPNLTLYDSKL